MTLLDLPQDVLIETCNYLDTRTLWKLMVSCKPMYKLAECRAVWINQLNRLSSEYAIVSGTYDVPSMSISDIRKAVIRPYRFERAVQFEEINPIHYRTTIEGEMFHWSKLAPGGRWLVTLSTPDDWQGPKFCRVWDLHSRAQVSEPYASLPIGEDNLAYDLVLRPDSDGKTFQVVFATQPPAPEGLAQWHIGILQFDHLNQAGERLRQMHTFEASGHGNIILLIGNYIVDGDSIVRASEINPGAATMHGGIGLIPASRLILAFETEGFAVFDNSKAEIACFGPMAATGPIDFDPTVVPLSVTPIPGIHLPTGSTYWCRYCDIIHSFGGTRGSSAVLSTYATNTSIYIELKDSPLQISDLRVFDGRVQYHGIGHAKTIDGLVVIADGPFNLTVVFEDGQTELNELPVTRRSQIPLSIGATYSFICPIGGVVGSEVHNEIWIWSID